MRLSERMIVVQKGSSRPLSFSGLHLTGESAIPIASLKVEIADASMEIEVGVHDCRMHSVFL